MMHSLFKDAQRKIGSFFVSAQLTKTSFFKDLEGLS